LVGKGEDLGRSELVARDVNWIAGDPPAGPLRAGVRIRHRSAEAPATVEPLSGGRARVRFDAPQRAVTPGQAAVFYDGETCLGGGWIGEATAP
jgi:tRNA-specific 2-thiouridylase